MFTRTSKIFHKEVLLMITLASILSVVATYTVIYLVANRFDKKSPSEEVIFINVAKQA